MQSILLPSVHILKICVCAILNQVILSNGKMQKNIAIPDLFACLNAKKFMEIGIVTTIIIMFIL